MHKLVAESKKQPRQDGHRIADGNGQVLVFMTRAEAGPSL
jgi:hypothetical protein